MFTLFSISYVLLVLPLSIRVTSVSLQHRWPKGSTSAAPRISHSDFFTYHLIFAEVIGAFGCILSIYGIHMFDMTALQVGVYLFSLNWYAQDFFHTLTCMDRYLAVVHPISYFTLKKDRGTGIRNVSIACAWGLCLVGLAFVLMDNYIILDFCFLLLCFVVVSFCNISALCALIRPHPGAQGAGWENVDQSKKKAFYTIFIIMGVLVVRFVIGLMWAVLFLWRQDNNCLFMMVGPFFNIPCSIVLPLLFLHRAGKLNV